MAQMDVRINFETNAKLVKQQIADLNRQVSTLQSNSARLNAALDANKASSKALTGDIRARNTIIKLDKQINDLATRRAASITKGYNFGAQDQFIKGLVKQNEVMRIQRKIMDDNATAMVNLGKNTQWAGRQLVVGFTVPLTIAAGAAMKAYSDLEKQLVKFKRVYGDISTTTKQTDDMANSVSKLADEWVKYGVAVSDTIGLAAEAAGAGFQGKQLMTQVEAANKLAVLGQLEQQKAMTATIALQSTFKMSNQELASSINFLNQLENQTMVTMTDMTTAIPKAATVIEGLGGSVKDLGIMMAALREGGVTAAEGANALKSGLGSLLNPSKAAEEALKNIGIMLPDLWKQSEENGKGVLFVVEELSRGLEKLGQTQKQQLIEELFGKHQFARMNALLSNINKGTQATQAKAVAGTTQLERALIAQKELGKLGESSLTKFQASVQKLKSAIMPLGKIIMDFVTPIVEWVAKIADKFNDLPNIVQKMIIGFTALGGVVAPIFLMLLGQIQNMLGNGMKLINFLRNWGKDTQWIKQENLTLADALHKVDAQLIAENALLQKNIALWEGRQAAAMQSGRPFTEPRPTPRRRFASGGNVAGSGSGDTIPALLTPGEFVVNKKAAKQHSATLAAMNAGNLPGFAFGVGPLKVPTRGKIKEEDRNVDVKIRQAQTEEKIAKQDAKQQAEAKKKAYSNLIAYKNKENVAVKQEYERTRRSFPSLNLSVFESAWGKWAQSHILPADAERERRELSGIKNKEWNYAGNLIMDNQMINVNVPGAAQHPTQSIEAQGFKNLMGHKLQGAAINPNHLITEKLAEYRTGAGASFYDRLMGDNFLFMNLHGGKNRKTKKGFGDQFRFNPVQEFAAGGFVPGTGNKDTVPAMLSPGEAVIKKSAAKKFSGILSAMNRGSIGLFADGNTHGYERELGAAALSSTERAELAKPFKDAIEDMVYEMSNLFGYGAEKAADLRQQIERDQQAFDAAHVIREVDEQDNKIWRNENLVQVPKGENVKMEALSKSANNLRILDDTAKMMGIAMEKRTDLIERLTRQEHIVEQEQRDLLASIVTRTEQYRLSAVAVGQPLKRADQLSDAFQGVSGAAFIGGLGITPQNYATKQQMNKVEVDELYVTSDAVNLPENRPRPGGRPPNAPPGTPPPPAHPPGGPGGGDGGGGAGSPDNPDQPSPDDDVIRRSSHFDPSSLLLMFSMFGDQLGGLTDSLGILNEAVGVAGMALMGLQVAGVDTSSAGGGWRGLWGGGTPDANATGWKKAFGKWGLGAGAVGGTVGMVGGGALGNVVSDQRGGAADVAGRAVSWGATGAGLGMAFGPWGAALGLATGALAGFVVQVRENTKAMKEAVKSSQGAAVAWDKIGKELTTKYNLGGNQSINDQTGLAEVIAGGNEDLAKLLQDQMAGEDNEWNRRIAALQQQEPRGQYLGADNELRQLTLELRGQGLKDKEIQVIADAFLAALPGQLKTDLKSNEIQSTPDILADLDIIQGQITAMVGVISTTAAIPPEDFGRPGRGRAGLRRSKKSEVMEDLYSELGFNAREAAAGLSGALGSLTDVLINSSTDVDQYAATMKDLNDVYTQSAEVQAALNLALQNAIDADSSEDIDRATKALNDFRATAYAPVQDFMTSEAGKAAGYDQSTFDKWVADANTSNIPALELSQNAMVLISNGIDINGMTAQNQDTLAAVVGVRQQALAGMEQFKTSIEGGQQALATIDKYQGALESLRDLKGDLKDIKIEADLTIARIHLEERVLAKFVGKFNKAFGTSINSFADAQYQIDKIGNKIQAIQLKVIDPIQEKADDLSRLNELDQRKIDEIRDKAKEKIDEENEALEEQADILERIRAEHEFINKQQMNAVDIASALGQGDVAAATQAMIQSNRNVGDYAASLQDRQMQQSEQGSTSGLTPEQDAQITALEAQIAEREKTIQGYEDQIYNINEKQIEPLQRRSELMSLMLNTTKTDLEYQQANINGIDEENRQRALALTAAQESTIEAEKRVAEQQKIVDGIKSEIIQIQKKYGIEGEALDTTKGKIEDNIATWKTGLAASEATITSLNADIASMAAGSQRVFDKWNKVIPAGGLANTLAMAMEFVRTGKVPSYKEWAAAQARTSDAIAAANTAAAHAAHEGRTDDHAYAGGTIDGTGGMDSVPTMLTPGEFVMRKSAVDRIGSENLARMNRGNDHMYRGGRVQRFATGGEVFYDSMAEPLLAGFMAEKKIQDAVYNMQTAVAGPYGGPGARPEYIPTGPIPGLGKDPGPSGMAAEQAGWIKPSAVRMMRYVKQAFPWAKGTTYMSNGEHGSGKAVDYWPSLSYKSEAGRKQGWDMARFAEKWRGPLGVNGIIFDDKVTGYGRWGGWRPYSHYSGSKSDTDRHLDHAHILNYKNGGMVPGIGNLDTMPSMLTPGEFVLNKGAVGRVGTLPLKALNQGYGSVNLNPTGSEEDGQVVYNNYDLTFNISEASDPRDIADVVMREIKRGSNSKVRTRR